METARMEVQEQEVDKGINLGGKEGEKHFCPLLPPTLRGKEATDGERKCGTDGGDGFMK